MGNVIEKITKSLFYYALSCFHMLFLFLSVHVFHCGCLVEWPEHRKVASHTKHNSVKEHEEKKKKMLQGYKSIQLNLSSSNWDIARKAFTICNAIAFMLVYKRSRATFVSVNVFGCGLPQLFSMFCVRTIQ